MEIVELGSCRFDPATRQFTGNRGQAELSPLAGRFLTTLAKHRGDVVSRSKLIDELWAGNFLVGDPALNRLVSEVRGAVAKAQSGRLIETVQRTGYRLVSVQQATIPSPIAYRPARTWLAPALIVIVVIALALHWLIEGLTGLAWVRWHPN